MRRSKLYKAQAATFQLDQRYSLDEALALLKAMPTVKFDQTVEMAIRLGVDAGTVGMVRELVRVMGEAVKLRTVILAGGDAKFFAAAFPEWRLASEEFTLQGVRLAAEKLIF